jgi:hypothetical protein
MRRVNRLVKRLAIGFVFLVLLLGALAIIGFYRGLTPLPKPPAGVRLEPLLPPISRQDLKPDNAAFYYAKAVDLLQSYKQSSESRSQMEAFVAGNIPADTRAIEQTLTDCREALNLCREGTHVSFCEMPSLDYTTNTTAFVAPLRQLARLLVVEGKLAERNGEAGRAITNDLAIVTLGRDCSKGGPIIYNLVGDSLIGISALNIRAFVLQKSVLPKETRYIMDQLDQIQKDSAPFADTLRYELADAKEIMDRDMFERLKWGQKIASRHAIFCTFDAAYGELIQDAEKPFWESNTKAITEKWVQSAKPTWLWVINRPIAHIMIGMLLPAMQSPRVKAVRANLEFEATRVVCAVKSYQLTHGAPPEHLADLVPSFLASLPIDPFDGKSLRYRHDGTNWVIWSVGSDLKDDNAAWHEFKYRKQHGENRTGGDIYFKSTEPQDDLAFYLSRKDSKGSR